MVTALPRAVRIALRVPIAYRTPSDEAWFQSRILNISESGVLFGPTGLTQGAAVEVMFVAPKPIGSIAPGKLVCVGEVVRTTEAGAAAASFTECRFVLDA